MHAHDHRRRQILHDACWINIHIKNWPKPHTEAQSGTCCLNGLHKDKLKTLSEIADPFLLQSSSGTKNNEKKRGSESFEKDEAAGIAAVAGHSIENECTMCQSVRSLLGKHIAMGINGCRKQGGGLKSALMLTIKIRRSVTKLR